MHLHVPSPRGNGPGEDAEALHPSACQSVGSARPRSHPAEERCRGPSLPVGPPGEGPSLLLPGPGRPPGPSLRPRHASSWPPRSLRRGPVALNVAPARPERRGRRPRAARPQHAVAPRREQWMNHARLEAGRRRSAFCVVQVPMGMSEPGYAGEPGVHSAPAPAMSSTSCRASGWEISSPRAAGRRPPPAAGAFLPLPPPSPLGFPSSRDPRPFLSLSLPWLSRRPLQRSPRPRRGGRISGASPRGPQAARPSPPLLPVLPHLTDRSAPTGQKRRRQFSMLLLLLLLLLLPLLPPLLLLPLLLLLLLLLALLVLLLLRMLLLPLLLLIAAVAAAVAALMAAAVPFPAASCCSNALLLLPAAASAAAAMQPCSFMLHAACGCMQSAAAACCCAAGAPATLRRRGFPQGGGRRPRPRLRACGVGRARSGTSGREGGRAGAGARGGRGVAGAPSGSPALSPLIGPPPYPSLPFPCARVRSAALHPALCKRGRALSPLMCPLPYPPCTTQLLHQRLCAGPAATSLLPPFPSNPPALHTCAGSAAPSPRSSAPLATYLSPPASHPRPLFKLGPVPLGSLLGLATPLRGRASAGL